MGIYWEYVVVQVLFNNILGIYCEYVVELPLYWERKCWNGYILAICGGRCETDILIYSLFNMEYIEN